MLQYTFQDIKNLLLKSVYEYGCEAELRLEFADKPHEYMIIMYDGHCSFQRCGAKEEQSGEYDYLTLDELYRAQQIDDIILERDWNNIRTFDCMDFDVLGLW